MTDGQLAPGPSPRQPGFGEQLRLEFVTSDPPPARSLEAFDPFVTLETRGRFARTLLARVAGPAGQTVCEVALRIQHDDYRLRELEGWNNGDVEAQWSRQFRLWSSAAASNAAPKVLDILPLPGDGGAPCLPPTLYCKERRVLFTALCPECGSALETCRDDALLGSFDLPKFHETLQRFLYCRNCQEAGRGSLFYAPVIADAKLRTNPAVRQQVDLFRNFRDLARNGGSLPCYGCSFVPTCYPEDDPRGGEVVARLTRVSFFDFRCFALQPTRGFYYDEFVALLGGRRFDALVPRTDESYQHRVGDAAVRYAATQRYLFEDDPAGKLPLEVLRLKLALFSQLVAAVSRLHQATRLPDLGLSPASVMVELVDGVPGMPLFWNFRTQLIEVGGAAVRRLKDLEPEQLEPPLLDPPPLRDPLYAAEDAARMQSPNREFKGSLLITALSEGPDSRWTIDSTLVSEEFDLGGLTQKDVVRVDVYQTRPVPLSLAFFAHLLGTQGRGYGLRSVSTSLDPEVAGLLRRLAGQAPLEVTFTVHLCRHIPDDMQSLGLLLFATLAANAEQGAATVTKAARQVSESVLQFVRDTPDVQTDDVEEFAESVLARWEKQGVLARHQIFDRPSSWQPEAVAQIPDAFWFGALGLGVRALTQTPQFGFCRGRDDFDPQHPEVAADHLRAELEILRAKLDAELLAMGGKRAMYRDAIARVQSDLFPQDSGSARTRYRT